MSDSTMHRYDPCPAMDRLEASLLFAVSTWIEAESRNVSGAEQLALTVVDDVHELLVRANMSQADSPSRNTARKMLRLKESHE